MAGQDRGVVVFCFPYETGLFIINLQEEVTWCSSRKIRHMLPLSILVVDSKYMELTPLVEEDMLECIALGPSMK